MARPELAEFRGTWCVGTGALGTPQTLPGTGSPLLGCLCRARAHCRGFGKGRVCGSAGLSPPRGGQLQPQGESELARLAQLPPGSARAAPASAFLPGAGNLTASCVCVQTSQRKGVQSLECHRAGPVPGAGCALSSAGPTGLFLWPKHSEPGINQPAQEDRLHWV